MLIKCPECNLQVSDKATNCPHCGYPISTQIKVKTKYNKRRRLPNGFGQISEIKNRNLRNPYRAMITVGKNEFGRPICKPLKPESYFPTYNDAYLALVEYNRNPYDLAPAITVKALYEKWSEEYFKRVSDNAIRATTGAWVYCSSLYDIRVADVRPRHIKACMENGSIVVNGNIKQASPLIQIKIKSLFNLMLDYAVEYEIVDKNYARQFKISDELIKEKQTTKKEHISFTDEEISLLWSNINTIKDVDMILIQCYSGWRPQELCLLQVSNTNITNWTFKGGMKTDAGVDRIVPIHPKIQQLVLKRYEEACENGSKYLFNYFDRNNEHHQFTYAKYKTNFQEIRDRLHINPDHRPHDCRKHFVTMAKKYNVDEYAIKYMVGHLISDITEKVYTQRELDWFKDEIKKIK